MTIGQIHSDERGLTKFEWLGVVTAVLVLAVLIPQVRTAIDVLYETLVGKNNVGPDGTPQPGVLIRGIIVGVSSLAIFAGSILLLTYTNLGRRLAFLVTGAAFFVGATTLGYVLGGVMAARATLVASTQICIPSMIYNALFNTEQTRPA